MAYFTQVHFIRSLWHVAHLEIILKYFHPVFKFWINSLDRYAEVALCGSRVHTSVVTMYVVYYGGDQLFVSVRALDWLGYMSLPLKPSKGCPPGFERIPSMRHLEGSGSKHPESQKCDSGPALLGTWGWSLIAG